MTARKVLSYLLVAIYELVVLLLLVASLWRADGEGGGWTFSLYRVNVDEKAIFLALAMFVPIVFRYIFPYIEHIKVGDTEVSFRNRLEKMESKVHEMDGAIREVEKQAAVSAHKHEAAFFTIATSLSRELLVDRRRTRERNLRDTPLFLGQMDFSESWIVTRMMRKRLAALASEHESSFRVADQLSSAETTLMCFFRLLTGKIDMFIWYSGTGMKLADGSFEGVNVDDEEAVRAALNDVYEPLKLKWLPSLGFQDAESLVMPRSLADELGITDATDLKKHALKLTFGANREFFLRDWYYPALVRQGVRFRETTDDVGINDRIGGLLRGEFDVGVCMETSPWYTDPRIKVIEPSPVFPRLPQYAMPVCRSDVYEELKHYGIEQLRVGLSKEDMEAFLFQVRRYGIVNMEHPGVDGLVDEYLDDRERWRKKYSRRS